MLTDQNLKEIRQYLLTKKLPIDLLIEVNEHFICQTQNLMDIKRLNFTQAFEKVKSSWYPDLRLYWNKSLNLEDSSDFLRKAQREINFYYLKQAFPVSLFATISVILAALNFNAEIFSIYLSVLICVPILFLLFSYIRNYNLFRLPKKYPGYTLTLHQHFLASTAVLGSLIINILTRVWEAPEKTRALFAFENFQDQGFRFSFILLCMLLLFSAITFSFISHKKYLKQLKTLQPFLKYL